MVKPPLAYQQANDAAREIMKRYVQGGRNRESSLNSYENKKFDKRQKSNLAVPVLQQNSSMNA